MNMNNAQKKYLKVTFPSKYKLKEWAMLGDDISAQSMDTLWTSKVLNALRQSSNQVNQEAYSRLSKQTKEDRLKELESVVEERNKKVVLHPTVLRYQPTVEKRKADDTQALVWPKKRVTAHLRSESSSREPRRPLLTINDSFFSDDSDSDMSDSDGSDSDGSGSGEKDDPVVPPCFSTLGQEASWTINGVDMVEKFQEFCAANSDRKDLFLGGAADVTYESAFYIALEEDIQTAARDFPDPPDIYKRWPTLQPMLDRVLRSNRYEDVAKAVRLEGMMDPVASYLFTIVMAYHHYFAFKIEIPRDMDEREHFKRLTWTFLQTPLTMCHVESRYYGSLIAGAEERENEGSGWPSEYHEAGRRAAAVAIHNYHHVLLVEAPEPQDSDMMSRRQHRWRLTKVMRDTWISQARSISTLNVPHRGLTVFGCSPSKDGTKLLQMDYHGIHRLKQFDQFTIPHRAEDFGFRMRCAVVSCLQLAARIEEEIKRRKETKEVLPYPQRVALMHAVARMEEEAGIHQRRY
ncbi:hypothetical protein EMPS_01994 [Entomortierella parvispora]|uniref:Uncharacterized protein n=1 Tax=Entomortierella parvispora TaxID=205924 RepID=A0A9P3H3Y7_9FUNG|nr:hypothetical protein EMPS_01994 [Entomortierella parvispora]